MNRLYLVIGRRETLLPIVSQRCQTLAMLVHRELRIGKEPPTLEAEIICVATFWSSPMPLAVDITSLHQYRLFYSGVKPMQSIGS